MKKFSKNDKGSSGKEEKTARAERASKRMRIANEQKVTEARPSLPPPPVVDPFFKKFGYVGKALAESLRMFSLDIVGLTASYLLFPSISAPGIKLRKLKLIHVKRVCYSVSCARNGEIWIGNRDGFCVYDPEGDQKIHNVYELDGVTSASVTGIAFHGDQVWLSLGTHDRVQVISHANFKTIRVIGKSGNKKSQFKSPSRIAISPSSNQVFIADTDNNRVQVFDQDGKFLSKFPVLKGYGSPCGICLAGEELTVGGWALAQNVTTQGEVKDTLAHTDFSNPGMCSQTYESMGFILDVARDLAGAYVVASKENIAVYHDRNNTLSWRAFENIRAASFQFKEFLQQHKVTGMAIDVFNRVVIVTENNVLAIFEFACE